MNRETPAQGRIRLAATEVMARKGIAGATTHLIARRARCSQAIIYKYWDGKEALAREVFEEANRGLMEAMEADCAAAVGGERVQGALLGLVRFARAQPDAFAFLFHVFHSEYAVWLASRPKPRDLMMRELDRAAAAGAIPETNQQVKAALLLGMAIRLAFFEHQGLTGTTSVSAEGILGKAVAEVLRV